MNLKPNLNSEVFSISNLWSEVVEDVVKRFIFVVRYRHTMTPLKSIDGKSQSLDPFKPRLTQNQTIFPTHVCTIR